MTLPAFAAGAAFAAAPPPAGSSAPPAAAPTVAATSAAADPPPASGGALIANAILGALDVLIPPYALWGGVGAFALIVLVVVVVGLCCCSSSRKEEYDELPGDDGLDLPRPSSPPKAPPKRLASPFDSLSLKTANVQPDRKQPLRQPLPTRGTPTESKMTPLMMPVPIPAPIPSTMKVPEMLTTVSLPPKFHLLDEPPEQQIEVSTGFVTITFNYRASVKKMFLFVHKTFDLPGEERTGFHKLQVHLALLPTKQQRFKTKWQLASHPVFEESFTLRGIPPEDIKNFALRVRVYGYEKMQKERLLGECVQSFAAVNLDAETTENLALEPRTSLPIATPITPDEERVSLAETINVTLKGRLTPEEKAKSPDAASKQPRHVQHGGGLPELQVSLAYFDLTGRVALEVIRGSHFHNRGQTKPPDTYVRCSLVSERGKELEKSKTSVRKAQPSPIYRESFLFPVPHFQLPDVTLVVCVYKKSGFRKKELVGWCSMGRTSSSQEGRLHWKEMIEGRGEVVTRWHVLLET